MMMMVALGIFTTLLGAAFGCLILELTLRAMAHSINAESKSGMVPNGVRAASHGMSTTGLRIG